PLICPLMSSAAGFGCCQPLEPGCWFSAATGLAAATAWIPGVGLAMTSKPSSITTRVTIFAKRIFILILESLAHGDRDRRAGRAHAARCVAHGYGLVAGRHQGDREGMRTRVTARELVVGREFAQLLGQCVAAGEVDDADVAIRHIAEPVESGDGGVERLVDHRGGGHGQAEA